jgi:uncharacterized membrane protein
MSSGIVPMPGVQSGFPLWMRWRKELRSPYVLTLLFSVILYSCYWSWLTISRVYSMVSAVYDLGLFVQHTWMFTQPGSIALYGLSGLPGPVAYLALVLDEPFEFLLSPLGLLNNFPAVLIVQSIALGAGALPLFAIARRILSSDRTALFVSLAYLLYFPLGGVNWFDAHFIAFFIPLFLLGFYFLIQRSFRLAGALLLIAGTTEFPSMLLVVLFALTLVGEAVLNGKFLKREWDLPALKFSIVLLVLSVLFFLYQFFYLGDYLGAQGFAATVHSGSGAGAAILSAPISIQNRLAVILLILAPVLFLTVLSLRWLVMLSPIGYAVFGTTYFGYAFPQIFRDQYGAVFIPFVFLGVVYAMPWLARFSPATGDDPSVKGEDRFHSLRRLSRPSNMGLAVLITVVVFASIFQPYGPLNGLGPDKFSLPSANLTRYNELQRLESLVPRNTPFVLFQNDMPGMLPRPLDYLATPLVSGIEDWRNVSIYDAEVGYFPLLLYSGHTVNASVLYAIDDPYNWGFAAKGSTTNNSMYYFIRDLYASGMYGILGEVDGMLVLERGYSGTPVMYSPFSQAIPARDLWVPDVAPGQWSNASWNGSKIPSGESVISATNADSTYAWDGPGLVLSPGTYEVGFSLMTTNLSPQDHISLVVAGENGKDILASENITGSNFSHADVWTNFSLTFYANNTYQQVTFPGLSVLWRGTLSIQTINLVQLSPGSPQYSRTGPAA